MHYLGLILTLSGFQAGEAPGSPRCQHWIEFVEGLNFMCFGVANPVEHQGPKVWLNFIASKLVEGTKGPLDKKTEKEVHCQLWE